MLALRDTKCFVDRVREMKNHIYFFASLPIILLTRFFTRDINDNYLCLYFNVDLYKS